MSDERGCHSLGGASLVLLPARLAACDTVTMTAARKLEPAHDPVLFAFDNAPIAEEPETEEERAAVEEARADGRSRVIDRAEMRSILERVRRAEHGG